MGVFGDKLQAVAVPVWSDQVIALPGSLLSLNSIHLGGAFYTNQVQIFTLAVTVVVFVDVSLISATAWGLAGLTAALAGIAFVLGTQSSPSTVYSLGLSAFPAILLGGLDSIVGALAGGAVIALIGATVTIYVGGQWADLIGYALLLAEARQQGRDHDGGRPRHRVRVYSLGEADSMCGPP